MGEISYDYSVDHPDGRITHNQVGEEGTFFFIPKKPGTYTIRVTPVEKPLTFFGRDVLQDRPDHFCFEDDQFRVVVFYETDGWRATLRRKPSGVNSIYITNRLTPQSALAVLEQACLAEAEFWMWKVVRYGDPDKK